MRSYGGNEDTVDAMREGLYRLARREGLAAVTVRGLAAESGLSVSAIRHWDSHHARIRAHALAHLVWRRRSIHAEVPFLRSDDALGALCALLRLASERRADHEVWLAYASAARVEEVLREIVADANREQRQVLGRFLGREPDDPVGDRHASAGGWARQHALRSCRPDHRGPGCRGAAASLCAMTAAAGVIGA